MKTNAKLSKIQAAMRHAASVGFNPYDSHATQALVMERRWKMEAGRMAYRSAEIERHRSEAVANQWLAQELQRNGHSPWKQAE